MTQYLKRPAETLQPGDVILPPERELRLWMRRENTKRELPETALHLTVLEVRESDPDKRGAWLIVKTRQSPEWNSTPFNFKTRPVTPWPVWTS